MLGGDVLSWFPLVSQLLIVSNSGTGFPSIRGLRGQKARYLRDVSRWANDKDAELLRLGYAILFILSFFFPSKFSFLHLCCLKEIEEVKFCLLQANECLLALVQVKPEVVSWSPRIIVLHNFLSSEECEYLKAIARPRLQVSTVVDIKTGKVFAKFWTLQQML
ncbi:prolyl 4-hydroxylase 1-like [Brassica napus]|uniref:prolyl 4-hydroxylase 1-like n=1 Tax=Brassica napus TaxID=3708 RepID=UPI0020795186|nr:prolyl 4-hydroxylase 1-like [Brassica napus]